MLKKPPSGAEKIVNSTSSVIFSTSSVIFCSYLCNAGNAGEQPANEANSTFLCDDA